MCWSLDRNFMVMHDCQVRDKHSVSTITSVVSSKDIPFFTGSLLCCCCMCAFSCLSTYHCLQCYITGLLIVYTRLWATFYFTRIPWQENNFISQIVYPIIFHVLIPQCLLVIFYFFLFNIPKYYFLLLIVFTQIFLG